MYNSCYLPALLSGLNPTLHGVLVLAVAVVGLQRDHPQFVLDLHAVEAAPGREERERERPENGVGLVSLEGREEDETILAEVF